MKPLRTKQKIILMTVTITCALLLLLFFIYIPKRSELKKIQTELKEIENNIEMIEKMGGKEKNIDIAITEFDKKLKSLKSKLPSKEEAVLRELARIAVESGLQVDSIVPSELKDCSLPINVKGYECKEMDVEIELLGSYMQLGEYMGILYNKFPTIININSMELDKMGEDKGTSKLQILIGITLYIFLPE